MTGNTSKKLFLVIPPQRGLLQGFSTGIINIASFVDSRMPEINTEIIDLSQVSIDTIQESFGEKLKNTADAHCVVGITTTTATYQSALAVARAVKQNRPESLVVFGGHHASADPATILRHHPDVVDCIVIGEGETTLVELIRSLPDFTSVPGLAFLRDATYHMNPGPTLLAPSELDALPLVFRGNEIYKSPGKFDNITYVSSRGCPHACAFCAVSNQKIRTKSIRKFIADIIELTQQGFSRIAIEDNFFAHSPERTRNLCTELYKLKKTEIPFTWNCQTRVESLADSGIVELMALSGCEAVYIGVESFNPDQLLYLKKTPQPERYVSMLCRTVVPNLLGSCVQCYLNLQLGLPGETRKHYECTLTTLGHLGALAAACGKTITVFPQLHVVYPGTSLFADGVRQGRYPKDVFEAFTLWESRQAPVLTWLGEHFAHGPGGLPAGILHPAGLRRAEYVVDERTVDRISDVMKSMGRIPGIEVFQYGRYLVRQGADISIRQAATL